MVDRLRICPDLNDYPMLDGVADVEIKVKGTPEITRFTEFKVRMSDSALAHTLIHDCFVPNTIVVHSPEDERGVPMHPAIAVERVTEGFSLEQFARNAFLAANAQKNAQNIILEEEANGN